MRKQVGNQNKKKLLRLATFGSYGKLYHTHFVFVSHKLFCGAVFRPSPLLHAGVTVPLSYTLLLETATNASTT